MKYTDDRTKGAGKWFWQKEDPTENVKASNLCLSQCLQLEPHTRFIGNSNEKRVQNITRKNVFVYI